ncbi:MAG: PQQ-binding-like beta-propeller repeat protein, partial [Gemmataceae bacterium]|nr:PQQ-binding-like beta-propeller repeat protein [Gemmataceae bacterium]
PPAAEVAAVDAHGDPLPPGAVARLGTVRFRLGMWPWHVAASPDGSKLATVGYRLDAPQVLTVWDATTGRSLREVTLRWAEVTALHWPPDGRGLALLKTNADQYAVWEFTDERAEPPPGNMTGVRTVADGTFAASAFSADGKWLSAGLRAGKGGRETRLKVWPVKPGRPVWFADLSWAADLPDGLIWLHFTPDGRRLVGVTEERKGDGGDGFGPGLGRQKAGARKAFVRDAATGKELRTFPLPAGECRAFALHPDGTTLSAGGDAGRVTAYDLETGKPGRTIDAFPPAAGAAAPPPVDLLAVTADGGTLIAVDLIAGVAAFDPATGRERWRHADGDARQVMALALLADGKRFAVGCSDGAVVLGDVAAGKIADGRQGHRGRVTAVATDGRTAATGGADGTLRRWDLATGRELAVVPVEPAGRASFIGLAFRPDGGAVVGPWWLGGRGEVRVVDPATGRAVRDLTHPHRDINELSFGAGRPADWLPGGPVILAGPAERGNGTFAAIRAIRYGPDGTAVREYNPAGEAAGGSLAAVAASPDGRTVVVAGVLGRGGTPTGAVAVFDAETGKQLRAGTSPTVFIGAAFTPDGRSVVLTGYTAGNKPAPAVVVFDAATGAMASPFENPDRNEYRATHAPAVAPNGYQVAVAEFDRSVTVYELATGVIRQRLRGHRNDVNQLAFTPDGRRLVSVSTDGTGLVWDVGPPAPAGPVGTSDADRQKRWEALGSADPATAEMARGEWAADPAGLVAVAERLLKPAPPPTDAEVDALVDRLGADEFADREAAARALDRFGPDAARRANERLPGVASPEARRRLAD